MHIAILGSGQLARMMAEAGRPLGVTFSFLADDEEGARPVEGLGDIVYVTPERDAKTLYAALGSPEVVTVEKEATSVQLLRDLQAVTSVFPNPAAVEVTQHRFREKQYLNDLGIPTVPFQVVSTLDEMKQAIAALGMPCVVKSCEDGYDGKNQSVVKAPEDLEALEELSMQGQWVVEKWVEFSAELSMIAVRSQQGEMAFYPIAKNKHKNAVLLTSKAQCDSMCEQFESRSQQYLQRIMESFDYVGVMAAEYFVVDGELIVNELAPRVHNSGHWTQNSGACSQFENHVRALAGLPLGSTEPTFYAGMINLLGAEIDPANLTFQNSEMYAYNKRFRPGRKLGHINVWGQTPEIVDETINSLEQQIYSA